MDDMLGHLSPEEVEALKTTFLAQATEILDALNDAVLRLEAGEQDDDLLKTIQRYVHTLKGDAGAFGMTAFTTVAHKMEDLLGLVRQKGISLNREGIDLLLQGADLCEHFLHTPATEADQPDVEALLHAVDRHLGQVTAPRPGASGAAPENAGTAFPRPLTEYQARQISMAQGEGRQLYHIHITFDPHCTMRAVGGYLIFQHLAVLGEIIAAFPDPEGPEIERSPTLTLLFSTAQSVSAIEGAARVAGIAHTVVVSPYSSPPLETSGESSSEDWKDTPHSEEASAESERLTTPAGTPSAPASVLRVDTQRIDKVMNLVGELVIARSMFNQAFTSLEDKLPKDDLILRMGEANAVMERTVSDLQKSVMTIRMVPVDQVFRRFPRLVRDLSRDCGKQVSLEITGRSTELDKGIVDVIGEPLMHIIRNAVDHGIEPPEVRRNQGKPDAGTIWMSAHHEGNQIVITVRDDGKGINPDTVTRQAVERGLLSEEDAARLSGSDALDLIFLSGFSTAEKVTDISGRGIGMDVVKNLVERLKGSVRVDSTPGEGTSITLRLPLTLAIIKAMLFSIGSPQKGDRLYAIPLAAIVEITRTLPSEIHTVDGREVLRLRDQVVPLMRLSVALNLPHVTENGHRLFALILGLGDKKVGLLVDRLVGEQELVIKALEADWMGTLPGAGIIAGASILGDGTVVLILDPGALVEQTILRKRLTRRLVATAGPTPARPGPAAQKASPPEVA